VFVFRTAPVHNYRHTVSPAIPIIYS